MALSGDFAIAIEVGPTCMRVGGTLFGARDYAATGETE